MKRKNIYITLRLYILFYLKKHFCRLCVVFVYRRLYTHTHENSTHTGTNCRLSECKLRFMGIERDGKASNWLPCHVVVVIVVIVAKMITSMDLYIYMQIGTYVYRYPYQPN